ncbi:hypothetical protein EYF80_019820 [Liparis tanakae]|uniref:Uncharacterized protein n=1 Tax=Liparis tanakae TaxID=230148 RepID=A0A4Z2HW77_9TELE|nr:hypothetical protein EYF80_019820 [Liparis tanakae]
MSAFLGQTEGFIIPCVCCGAGGWYAPAEGAKPPWHRPRGVPAGPAWAGKQMSQSCTFVFCDLGMSLAVFVFGFLGKPVCERLSLGNVALLADGGQRGSSWCDVSLRTARVARGGAGRPMSCSGVRIGTFGRGGSCSSLAANTSLVQYANELARGQGARDDGGLGGKLPQHSFTQDTPRLVFKTNSDVLAPRPLVKRTISAQPLDPPHATAFSLAKAVAFFRFLFDLFHICNLFLSSAAQNSLALLCGPVGPRPVP